MHIQFLGAVRSVTGSMMVLQVNKASILIECGMYQGRRQESFEKNRNLPFTPRSIDAMVLSHAHIDHCGNIPQLVKQGFEGSIFCTNATQDLVRLMLRDSAHLQELDAEFMSKRNRKNGLPSVEPLYTTEDVDQSLDHFVGIGYNRPFHVLPDVQVTFLDAGHILGAAIVVLDVREGRKSARIVFTGDLGRKNLPILKDPVQAREADIFITESTYGDRLHEPFPDMKNRLRDIVRTTADRGGRIVVPAFSLGRTQEIVYVLHTLFNEGQIPPIPIFVDSPLSANVTEVFRLHPECFDEATRTEFLARQQDPFGFSRLQYIRTTEESRKLNDFKGPCMIISASGMCEGGRILHHLTHSVTNPKNTVLIVGFMAEHTLGRRLVQRAPVVRIFGEEMPLHAEVAIMNGFSAHADRDELMGYFNGLDRKKLRKVFVVHGESGQSESLAYAIRETGFRDVVLPDLGEKISL